MLIRHEFPILERDTQPLGVIRHDVNLPGELAIVVPEKCVFAFLGSWPDQYAAQHGCEKLGEYETITKVGLIYKTIYRGQEIGFAQAFLGAPAAAQQLDYLLGHGARAVIACGSCGALEPLAENEILIPTCALRDEGVSYHYLAPSRDIRLDAAPIDAMERAAAAAGVGVQRCKTWTTDAFYRETPDMVAYRRQEGCQVVDMECSALAAVARFRGATFGQILYTADTLADPEAHDARDWGRGCWARAFDLALEAAWQLDV